MRDVAACVDVDQRSLSVEIANATFVPSWKQGTNTNAYYPDRGQYRPAGRECVDMRGMEHPSAPPVPVALTANLPSGLLVSQPATVTRAATGDIACADSGLVSPREHPPGRENACKHKCKHTKIRY